MTRSAYTLEVAQASRRDFRRQLTQNIHQPGQLLFQLRPPLRFRLRPDERFLRREPGALALAVDLERNANSLQAATILYEIRSAQRSGTRCRFGC